MLRPSRRRIALAGALLVFAAGGGAQAEPVTVYAHAIPFDTSDFGETAAGELAYRGGLRLESQDDAFGGLSGLHVGDDGHRLTAITDRGMRLTARLAYDADGTLAGLDHADLSPIPDSRGKPLLGRPMTDTESLSPDGAGGWYIGFEQRHRIVHHPAQGPATVMPALPGLADAPRNGGLEALTRLPDGRLLAVAEAHGSVSFSHGWLGGSTGWAAVTYRRTGTFRPTGAATLPDGSVLFCERSFTPLTGVAARVIHVEASDIRAGAAIAGREIAVLRPPLNVDNMEAIAVRQDAEGRVLVYLLSDDNFSALQRTLLLMFEWRPTG